MGLTIVVFLGGCARSRPTFDGKRAFADLQTQVDFGPRVPGDEAHRRCAQWLHAQLATYADSVTEQHFSGVIPGRLDSVGMINIIARFGTRAGRRVLLGAHWDTRPWADMDPDSTKWFQSFAGANDGASGVAVLLEIARGLDSIPPPVGVDLVLFDGEDAGDYGTTPGLWCQGSTYFAAHLPTRYEWVIVVDMVGDRDLYLPQEAYSLRLARPLADRVWSLAARLGETAFAAGRGPEVFDDHIPFLMRGIPAIDVIDFEYAPWHTTQDVADRCSPASLRSVGRVLIETLYSG
ncbi:MAG: M28 family peptidase [Candidatus Zixiibacteriota bacterium]